MRGFTGIPLRKENAGNPRVRVSDVHGVARCKSNQGLARIAFITSKRLSTEGRSEGSLLRWVKSNVPRRSSKKSPPA